MTTFQTIDELMSFFETDDNSNRYVYWHDESGYHSVDPVPVPPELVGVTKLPNTVDNVRAFWGL